MTISKNIAQNLKTIMKKYGISQSKLARHANLTPAAISMILKGNRVPSLKSILSISEFLCVSIQLLAGYDEILFCDTDLWIWEASMLLKNLSKEDKDLIFTIAKRFKTND